MVGKEWKCTGKVEQPLERGTIAPLRFHSLRLVGVSVTLLDPGWVAQGSWNVQWELRGDHCGTSTGNACIGDSGTKPPAG